MSQNSSFEDSPSMFFYDEKENKQKFWNIIDFWKNITDIKLKPLQKIAKEYCGLCASASNIERLWSQGGLITVPNRNQLENETICRLLFCRSGLSIIKKKLGFE